MTWWLAGLQHNRKVHGLILALADSNLAVFEIESKFSLKTWRSIQDFFH